MLLHVPQFKRQCTDTRTSCHICCICAGLPRCALVQSARVISFTTAISSAGLSACLAVATAERIHPPAFKSGLELQRKRVLYQHIFTVPKPESLTKQSGKTLWTVTVLVQYRALRNRTGHRTQKSLFSSGLLVSFALANAAQDQLKSVLRINPQ